MRSDLLVQTPGGNLFKVMEEACEVQISIMKLIKSGCKATDGKTLITYNNVVTLSAELGDLESAIAAVKKDIADGKLVGFIDMTGVAFISDKEPANV